MWAFLLTTALLVLAIYAGYRFNMYLYARGILGSHHMHSDEEGAYPTRRKRDSSLIRVQDYGLHYARTGLLAFAIVILAMVLILIALIASLF